ncbi:MAG: hypothetical protein M1839_005023 [Geoglossum umbratile]|nr:MAG: hypothetical protein M1839_005023 [Geoglossum umbratile]
MSTIQSPPPPNAATAIPAFSTSAREAFEDFLKDSASRYRISKEKRINIISWIKDDFREPKTQNNYSQHHHALEGFQYDAERDLLLVLASENWPKERQVVVEGEIFRMIKQEHLLSKHAGQDTTWASVDLIDFRHQLDAPYGQSGPKYHWVMHIKNHFSKFTQLYPLQMKSSAEVAMRMSE